MQDLINLRRDVTELESNLRSIDQQITDIDNESVQARRRTADSFTESALLQKEYQTLLAAKQILQQPLQRNAQQTNLKFEQFTTQLQDTDIQLQQNTDELLRELRQLSLRKVSIGTSDADLNIQITDIHFLPPNNYCLKTDQSNDKTILVQFAKAALTASDMTTISLIQNNFDVFGCCELRSEPTKIPLRSCEHLDGILQQIELGQQYQLKFEGGDGTWSVFRGIEDGIELVE